MEDPAEYGIVTGQIVIFRGTKNSIAELSLRTVQP